MVDMTKSWRPKEIAALILGTALILLVLLFDESPDIFSSLPGNGQHDAVRGRRGLMLYEDDASKEYPWAMRNIIPLTTIPDPQKETVLFWNIPKSGGTTGKDLYRCLGRNVEIQSKQEEILAAEEWGLVRSGQVDVIFSSFPDFATEHLFDQTHKGRFLAMMRHPVDRLMSKFFYLQEATWENTYRPEWKDMDVLEWAENHNNDNDHMVKKLAGKSLGDEATRTDLISAKKTMRQRFIIGLVQEMKESFKRFNIVMGINDNTNKNHKRCMLQYFGKGEGKKSTFHPRVKQGSPAWNLLAEKNKFDIELFEYAVQLFEEQTKQIKQYKWALQPAPKPKEQKAPTIDTVV